MPNWKTLAASALVASASLASSVLAQDAAAPPITDLPRNQTLIINNPENPQLAPDNFNLWVIANGSGNSNGLHQLSLDTLWFIDPEAGLKGSTYNELASGPAQYNADFTGDADDE